MGHVYFIQVISSGNVKIGYSKNIKSRLSTIQTSIPEKIKLLGFISGDKVKEKELHKKFNLYHIRGEWFRCSSTLIDYINTHSEMILSNGMNTHIILNEDGVTTNIFGKIPKE
jgi:hypothetical protein